MPLRTGILIWAALALLCVGCSEETKREAARLEAQLRGDTLLSLDSQLVGAGTSVDSLAISSMTSQTVTNSEGIPTTVDSNAAPSEPKSDAGAVSTNQVAAEVFNRPADSVIPDVNAIPAENGSVPPKRMPRYIEDAYTVQVASSTDQAFSQRIVDSFMARGYEAYLGTITRDGTTYYRVRVGRFATSTEANMVAVEINQKYSLQSWVDKITK